MFVQCAQGACVLVSRGMGMIWNGIGGVSIGMYGEVGAVWTIRDSMPKLCDSRRGSQACSRPRSSVPGAESRRRRSIGGGGTDGGFCTRVVESVSVSDYMKS